MHEQAQTSLPAENLLPRTRGAALPDPFFLSEDRTTNFTAPSYLPRLGGSPDVFSPASVLLKQTSILTIFSINHLRIRGGICHAFPSARIGGGFVYIG